MIDDIIPQLQTQKLFRPGNDLIDWLQPTVRMKTHPSSKKQWAKGSSRIGGLPDLPKGVRWPKYDGAAMEFLAQINLADVAPHDKEGVLPPTGLLSFFFDPEYDSQFDYPLSGRKGWSVSYFQDDFSLLRRTSVPPTLPEESISPVQEISFISALSLPALPSIFLEDKRFSLEEASSYSHIFDQVAQFYNESGEQGVHQLLGHPYDLQEDIFLECVRVLHTPPFRPGISPTFPSVLLPDGSIPEHLKQEAQEWLLLLQVDMRALERPFWTGCLFYYLLPKFALTSQDFSQAWLVIQCD